MDQNMYQLLNTTNVKNQIGFFLNMYCVDGQSITNRDTQQDANYIQKSVICLHGIVLN